MTLNWLCLTCIASIGMVLFGLYMIMWKLNWNVERDDNDKPNGSPRE